ncbi:MAG TPA: phosphoenolpyruvate carboxykinase (GTP) [Candidatus Brocadiia bacterium]|nr:phosphoenolpyruvate carboxykinase (GTP) [Candidatus Brocadiia bacterium]
MSNQSLKLLKSRLDARNFAALEAIDNERLHAFVADAVELCCPEKVWVSTDNSQDIDFTRKMALQLGEEKPLAITGHTIHFDGIEDQGRDREATKYLVPKGQALSAALNQMDRDEGLKEVREAMKGSMQGRIMIVRFMTLGPNNSDFSTPCVECTDSFYVSHSLNLLYRLGYEEFKRLADKASFFAILHSAGKLDARMVSAEPANKKIYIDHTAETVYSINTQYAGNTVGLKKLALRLSIRKADREGWLAEHMFLMGVRGKHGRKTYFAGAFPSACGKTSTAMLPGETILGDDIAYFRVVEGRCMAANAESGIFGIIQNVCEKDDPAIWAVLNKPGEVIFSNVLVKDSKPYWLGMGIDIPSEGESFCGAWKKDMKDAKNEEIPCAHKNARYAVTLKALENCDSELDNPEGIELSAILYGGRDAKAYVPCQQSFSWEHGIVAYGAALETETTFATVGKEGIPEINLMSIQDFVAISLGKYVRNNLEFGKKLIKPPQIFGVNYFLRHLPAEADKEEEKRTGKKKLPPFVNGIRDKHVWVKWAERRVHGEIGCIEAPTGLIPRYEDLKALFKELLGKDYTPDDYEKQFTIRISENLAKIDRVVKFHREKVTESPDEVFKVMEEQRRLLKVAFDKFGDLVSPTNLPEHD